MRLFAISAALSLLCAALAACGDASEAQQALPPPPQVSVANPLVQEVVDWNDVVGRFEAAQRVDVRARAGGFVQQVHFQDGQAVRAGQLLFTLDPAPARAAVAAAEARLAQANAQLILAQSQVRRSERLLALEFASQAAVDTDRAGVAQAAAAVQVAQADLRARRLELGFTRVTAPASGRVSDRRVDAGNVVAGGTSAGDVLTTIVTDSPIHFAFEGAEPLLLQAQRQTGGGRGAPIQIRLQDESEYRWSGRLDFTDNAVDPASGTVRLRAVVQNDGGFLRPGMFGHARLAGGQAYSALLVPDAAVVTDGPRRLVYTVAPDGAVAPRPVVLGPLSGGMRVIRSGVGPQDLIIVNGVGRAMPGQRVTPRRVALTAPPAAEATEPATLSPPASTATPAGALTAARS